MQALKIVAEGLTTSFRYPHFKQSIHPSFEAPPPATIYGHICSALGYWFNPDEAAFAYHFSFEAEFVDLEHIIVLSRGTGKLEGTDLPEALRGNVNPFERHILFRPKMVLYLNRPDWLAAFQSPTYAVSLGRSQDLFNYRSVEIVNLDQRQEAYLEHTILPYEMALYTQRGYVVLMPRWIDYADGRRPTFARYLILHETVHMPPDVLFGDHPPPDLWVDPSSPVKRGQYLGLVFHTFVGEAHENFTLA